MDIILCFWVGGVTWCETKVDGFCVSFCRGGELAFFVIEMASLCSTIKQGCAASEEGGARAPSRMCRY